ncbi:MAG: extracellular solute-binding protein [Clostridium sp.]|nr:extracellular solute-binding protein [Clostridium sp.]
MKKRKILASILSIALVGAIFTGCGSKDNDEPDTGDTPVESPADDAEKEPEPEADDGDELVVYCPHNAEVINPIVKEFGERTGIKVDIVAAGTGELLKRVESESDNPLGDVMWGGGAESLDSFKEYFSPYKTSEDSHIPDNFKDEDNYWTGFSALPMVIMYNKNLVKEDEVPKTWKDLTDPKYKGKIAYAEPGKSGSSYTTLVTMLEARKEDGDDGWDFIREFIANLDGKIIESSSGVYVGVADGEYSLGLTLEEAAMRYVNEGAEVGIVYPEDGTSAVPDGIAVIKGAKNQANAEKFVDFVTGKDVQEIVVKDFSRRSIRDDMDAPEGLGSIEDIKLVDYDFAWAAGNKEEVLDKWKDIVVGK